MPSISPERRKDSERHRSRSPAGERKDGRRRDEGDRHDGDEGRADRQRDRSPERKVDMGPTSVRRSEGEEQPEARREDLREVLNRARGKESAAPAEANVPPRQAATDVPAGPSAAAAEGTAAGAGETRKPAPLGKTGGVYIPPFKLARMMAEVSDRASPEYQRLTWEALKKSLNGIINKVNVVNIKAILVEVFRENLVRGRGLFCRSMMKSQLASPSFSPVYAALTAVVNTKFPEIGELLLSRLVLQFKRSYKRNDKPVCTAAAKFIAHLINQGVAHEVLALEMLILMLEKPSDDSVEMAVEFTKEVGAFLMEVAPAGLQSIFDRFRAVLHEGLIDKRVQFIIEGLTQIRRRKFEEHPAIKPELDLVEGEDQITHQMELEDTPDPQTSLDIFKLDPQYEEHEKQYKAIMREILGEDEVSDDDGEGKEKGDDDDDEEEEEEAEEAAAQQAAQQIIHDETQTNLVNLRRTIYLTIMSALDFEEAGHKLMKIGVQPGQEIELVTMIIECCSQERTYKRFFGLLAQRFCYVNRVYSDHFADCFRKQYMVIHRLETNKLRNVASLFAHLLATDALPWDVLRCVHLTEEDTTSSSRIFIKYLFQELSSTLGLVKLNERLNDPTCQEWYDGIFPKDTQANLRFAINFFTSIGLGGLTDSMRQFYKEMPRIMAERQAALAAQNPQPSSSSDDSSSSDSSSSDSDSDSSSSSSDSSSSDSSSSDSDSDEEDRRRRSKGRAKRKAEGEARDAGRGDKRQARGGDVRDEGRGRGDRGGKGSREEDPRERERFDGGRGQDRHAGGRGRVEDDRVDKKRPSRRSDDEEEEGEHRDRRPAADRRGGSRGDDERRGERYEDRDGRRVDARRSSDDQDRQRGEEERREKGRRSEDREEERREKGRRSEDRDRDDRRLSADRGREGRRERRDERDDDRRRR